MAAALLSCSTMPDRSDGEDSADTSGSVAVCSGSITAGFYRYEPYDTYTYTCGEAGYTMVYQGENGLMLGDSSIIMQDSCSFITSDYYCSGIYDDRTIDVHCGGCYYSMTAVMGAGCAGGVEQGLYDIEPSVSYYGAPCEAGVRELAQTGSDLTFGDLEGMIDEKCAVGFIAPSNDTCFGTYVNGIMTLECAECTLTATSMPLSANSELGVYKKYFSTWGDNCRDKGFGRTFRLFITDAYFDPDGWLAMTSDTTKLEGYDSGGALLFSASLNNDGTMQFTAGSETVDARLDPFDLPLASVPYFYATFSPSGCDYAYNP